MQKKYDEIMQEVDARMATIDLNGKGVVADCKVMIQFLKEKLAEMKTFLLSHPFESEADEITFFKYQKPMLVGRLMYCYKIFRIESKCPPYQEQADSYYMRRQEEQKLFFDRHVSFYQYYRSGATHHDAYYFVRGRQEISADAEYYDFDNEADFSTNYDRLVARIIAMEMLYAYLTARRRALQQPEGEPSALLLKEYRWTGTLVSLVELLYALDTNKCINNGKIEIEEFANYLGLVFHIDLKNCYNTYVDMKKRKEDSRTYFLDALQKDLNQRMDEDDEKKRKKR